MTWSLKYYLHSKYFFINHAMFHTYKNFQVSCSFKKQKVYFRWWKVIQNFPEFFRMSVVVCRLLFFMSVNLLASGKQVMRCCLINWVSFLKRKINLKSCCQQLENNFSKPILQTEQTERLSVKSNLRKFHACLKIAWHVWLKNNK